jgi:glycosyltransferase involved in cell wall biosynthesis
VRLAVVTDAWLPQANGVVTTLREVLGALGELGDAVTVVAPDRFRTVPCPTYPQIRLAVAGPRAIAEAIEAARPEFVHIATEGPLGWLARRHCRRQGRGFTTSFHTRFPEYLRARTPIPTSWSYAALRRFHNAGLGCMVATASLSRELSARGFCRLMAWPRGVDRSLFRPRENAELGLPRPIFLYVGRVAVEKNLPAFLTLELPGTKVVVGDGPERRRLETAFPAARFVGALHGESLAHAYSAADVLVFPSRTDTFGNVMLEALASGVPVAAYPVTGPGDLIDDPAVGALDEDLRAAALRALTLSREAARAFSARFSWSESGRRFRDNILTAKARL